jgi:hypothetical protein
VSFIFAFQEKRTVLLLRFFYKIAQGDITVFADCPGLVDLGASNTQISGEFSANFP